MLVRYRPFSYSWPKYFTNYFYQNYYEWIFELVRLSSDNKQIFDTFNQYG